MATAGVSTLGVKLYYCAETTAGTRPTSNYTQLTRINAIGGITQEPEQIDASALEDLVTRNIAGRTGTGDTVTVTVNVTTETLKEWKDLLDAYSGLTGGKGMWFEVVNDKLYDTPSGQSATAKVQGFYFKAQPPAKFPMPESNQNELQTVEIPLVIEDYEGYAEAKTS